ncbi:TniQ family protein [Methyloversatilis discipulorum]|uniref:TniQ family protein n=1 Tax=Methyloversatilis discipulorum TaxID=1119528 RepID=UPI00048546AC|nr:TniQ family protein [Methyloversatilis discipulorum]
MNRVVRNPRSVLHALEPRGWNTPDVESLLSYFCRLALSHSVSVTSLSRIVVKQMGSELREGFDWHERNLCGLGEAAETWAGALAALTSVGHLDRLTLLPWRQVIAQRGLAAKGGRWCPDCLEEDRRSGASPYFRLAWDIAAVTTCHKHHTSLVDVCPDCGRPGTRHRATYVVPGWCTHCGAFLGRSALQAQAVVSPEAIWTARQVGLLLSAQCDLSMQPTREGLRAVIGELVARLDHGRSAAFARRIGLGKGTVHHWVQVGGVPTLEASLRIALHVGLPLPKLLAGDLGGWLVPFAIAQRELDLGSVGIRRAPRELNWESMRAELTRFAALPVPISVAQAAQRLNVDRRHLYLQANKEARILGERWKRYVRSRGEEVQARARPYIEAACRALIEEGRAITLRELEARVPHDILSSVEHLFDMLQNIKQELDAN